MSEAAAHLRARAEGSARSFPALLARADRLAMTIVPGAHGRRRAGPGEEFWQYRRMQSGESAASIDWRRSARSDATYLRQTEWEAPQTVSVWADPGASMDYPQGAETKRDRARLLAMATCILLDRGGERFEVAGAGRRPSSGRRQLDEVALALDRLTSDREFGLPVPPSTPTAVQVLMSDFLSPGPELAEALARIGESVTPGVLLQIIDATEETFPFDGRTEFRSVGGGLVFETQRARQLKAAYQERLEERRAMLLAFCARTGWRMAVHRVQEPPRKALTWLYAAIGGSA